MTCWIHGNDALFFSSRRRQHLLCCTGTPPTKSDPVRRWFPLAFFRCVLFGRYLRSLDVLKRVWLSLRFTYRTLLRRTRFLSGWWSTFVWLVAGSFFTFVWWVAGSFFFVGIIEHSLINAEIFLEKASRVSNRTIIEFRNWRCRHSFCFWAFLPGYVHIYRSYVCCNRWFCCGKLAVSNALVRLCFVLIA